MYSYSEAYVESKLSGAQEEKGLELDRGVRSSREVWSQGWKVLFGPNPLKMRFCGGLERQEVNALPSSCCNVFTDTDTRSAIL